MKKLLTIILLFIAANSFSQSNPLYLGDTSKTIWSSSVGNTFSSRITTRGTTYANVFITPPEIIYPIATIEHESNFIEGSIDYKFATSTQIPKIDSLDIIHRIDKMLKSGNFCSGQKFIAGSDTIWLFKAQ